MFSKCVIKPRSYSTRYQMLWGVDQVRYAIESREGPGLAYSDESKWDIVRMDYDMVVSS